MDRGGLPAQVLHSKEVSVEVAMMDPHTTSRFCFGWTCCTGGCCRQSCSTALMIITAGWSSLSSMGVHQHLPSISALSMMHVCAAASVRLQTFNHVNVKVTCCALGEIMSGACCLLYRCYCQSSSCWKALRHGQQSLPTSLTLTSGRPSILPGLLAKGETQVIQIWQDGNSC